MGGNGRPWRLRPGKPKVKEEPDKWGHRAHLSGRERGRRSRGLFRLCARGRGNGPTAQARRGEAGEEGREARGPRERKGDWAGSGPKGREEVFNLFFILFNWLNELCAIQIISRALKIRGNFREYFKAQRILQNILGQ